MTDKPAIPASSSLPLRRFIPFRLEDLRRMCAEEVTQDEKAQRQLARAAGFIEACFHQEFRLLRGDLKQSYAPIDPDRDTRRLEAQRLEDAIVVVALCINDSSGNG